MLAWTKVRVRVRVRVMYVLSRRGGGNGHTRFSVSGVLAWGVRVRVVLGLGSGLPGGQARHVVLPAEG